jgi:hypothetical protein
MRNAPQRGQVKKIICLMKSHYKEILTTQGIMITNRVIQECPFDSRGEGGNICKGVIIEMGNDLGVKIQTQGDN